MLVLLPLQRVVVPRKRLQRLAAVLRPLLIVVITVVVVLRHAAVLLFEAILPVELVRQHREEHQFAAILHPEARVNKK
jgi:hypothetical protein